VKNILTYLAIVALAILFVACPSNEDSDNPKEETVDTLSLGSETAEGDTIHRPETAEGDTIH